MAIAILMGIKYLQHFWWISCGTNCYVWLHWRCDNKQVNSNYNHIPIMKIDNDLFFQTKDNFIINFKWYWKSCIPFGWFCDGSTVWSWNKIWCKYGFHILYEINFERIMSKSYIVRRLLYCLWHIIWNDLFRINLHLFHNTWNCDKEGWKNWVLSQMFQFTHWGL